MLLFVYLVSNLRLLLIAFLKQLPKEVLVSPQSHLQISAPASQYAKYMHNKKGFLPLFATIPSEQRQEKQEWEKHN